jgi:dGTPase
MFDFQELDELALWQELKAVIGWQKWEPFTPITRHEIVRELIGMSVMNVLENTAVNLRQHQIDTPEKVQTHPETLVTYSEEFGKKVKELKKFLLDRMYRHYRLIRMQTKAERFITELFGAYVKEPKMLPTDTQKRLESDNLHRVITDYIAGMTDRYALDEWQRLFDPYHRA